MIKINIVDPIGIHSGMKYYLDSFKNVLERIGGVDVSILSNYSDSNRKPFFYNFYEGNTIGKFYKLAKGILNLWTFSLTHRDDVFIILSYGTQIDALLIHATWAKIRIIDVHEVIVQGSESNIFFKRLFSRIFSKQKAVIYHSERAKTMLLELGFMGESFFVPHFEYNTDSDYDVKNINKNVYECIKKGKINLLFFGNITYSKGIDIFIQSINTLKNEIKDKINVIIAGKTLDDTFSNCDISSDVFSIAIQHLNDDEMKYLYSQTDYVILPYRQTSQSGVLEMAIHYNKPVVASNIPYFSMMLNKYPSFGLLTELDSASLNETWCRISNQDSHTGFYNEEDMRVYKTRTEDIVFIEEFSLFLKREHKI
jgi:glycosyltransferase involved in cell wall biosynthesis